MMITRKKGLSEEGQLALEALQRAVKNALDRKKRLGQYAVIWQDGKPKIIDFSEENQRETTPTKRGESCHSRVNH